MGHAHRHDAIDPAAARAPDCAASRHCDLPPPVRVRFGGLDGIWLHYGPIGPEQTPLAYHRAERAPMDRNAGEILVDTRDAWRRFEGCYLDLFCLDHRHASGGRRHVQDVEGQKHVLWRVFAVAWCKPEGPWITWTTPSIAPSDEYSQHPGQGWSSAATYVEYEKLHDLLEGSRPRRGRPSRWRDPAWVENARDLLDRVEKRKAEQPTQSIKSICDGLNIADRQYRQYRQFFRAERALGDGLYVISEGED